MNSRILISPALAVAAALGILPRAEAEQTNSITPKPQISMFSLGRSPTMYVDDRPLVSADCRHVASQSQSSKAMWNWAGIDVGLV